MNVMRSVVQQMPGLQQTIPQAPVAVNIQHNGLIAPAADLQLRKAQTPTPLSGSRRFAGDTLGGFLASRLQRPAA